MRYTLKHNKKDRQITLTGKMSDPPNYRYKSYLMTHNYTTITAYSNKFNIWLVNKQGDIFIKFIPSNIQMLQISDLTLTSSTKEDLLEKAHKVWGLDSIKNKITKIYAFKSKIDIRYTQITGYIVSAHITLKDNSRLCKELNGEFINYRDLESKIKKLERDDIFIEGYSELLRELDNQYGWFNHHPRIYKHSS